jgi:hypothetical protein
MKERNEKLIKESFEYAIKNVDEFEKEKKCGYVLVKFNFFKGTIATVSNAMEITEKEIKSKMSTQSNNVYCSAK